MHISTLYDDNNGDNNHHHDKLLQELSVGVKVTVWQGSFSPGGFFQ